MSRSLRIGILGTRGIPNHYGGFEQCAQFLAEGLAQRGHDVTVYNSSLHPYQRQRWQGVNIVHCTDSEDRFGTVGQFLYDYNCIRDARKRSFDVIMQMGYTSSSIWYRWWPRVPHLVNMDGLEFKRSKYSPAVQRFLEWAEKLATLRANLLIADNPAIEDYLKGKYNLPVQYISYGAEPPESFDPEAIKPYGLEPNGYNLVIARIEPENHIEEIVQAHARGEAVKPLVVVGGTGTPLAQKLKAYESDRARFIGAVYDASAVNALRHYCHQYFHGHSVGGTNPSLLEAMACECNIIAHDNPYNRSVLEKNALYFSDVDTLSQLIRSERNTEHENQAQSNNLQKLKQEHRWEQIVEAYENACYAVV